MVRFETGFESWIPCQRQLPISGQLINLNFLKVMELVQTTMTRTAKACDGWRCGLRINVIGDKCISMRQAGFNGKPKHDTIHIQESHLGKPTSTHESTVTTER
jgi:hypothetical protein